MSRDHNFGNPIGVFLKMTQLGFFSSHHRGVSEKKRGREPQGQAEEEPAENTQQQGRGKAELKPALLLLRRWHCDSPLFRLPPCIKDADGASANN